MIRKILIFPFLLLIYVYRYVISPLTPASCRHLPTCSEYAVESLKKHGIFKGLWLSVRRISRCHPWGTSGFDPVPDHYEFPFSIKKLETGKKAGRNQG
ncbi:MAG: membrane protein insertion efficiency factor YidD [Bacteroidetes bacterium]|nr:membrane protein insertion efficiency factor YidD [Bacteroidota bacterium]